MADYPDKGLEDYINLLFIKAANMDNSINTNLFMKEIELGVN